MVAQLQMQRAAHLAPLSQLALLGCANLHQVGAGCPASLWLHSSPTQTGTPACAATEEVPLSWHVAICHESP